MKAPYKTSKNDTSSIIKSLAKTKIRIIFFEKPTCLREKDSTIDPFR
ncbi:hypothetical protein GCM10007111_35740 [Virgibacillus kapii]|uniref:Uncharacterized protein n=1 Tax=Virgibacillus kapii TaxID=1638645 RepID=A0ABQ2DS16_9BACI|nr:hypothetical protein GCM10007111_35740 [Virgibacillus kapii]